MKIRLLQKNGNWFSMDCQVISANGESAEIYVPAWKATWAIHKTGMVANIGGNDWRIYDLNPDDCAELCKA